MRCVTWPAQRGSRKVTRLWVSMFCGPRGGKPCSGSRVPGSSPAWRCPCPWSALLSLARTLQDQRRAWAPPPVSRPLCPLPGHPLGAPWEPRLPSRGARGPGGPQRGRPVLSAVRKRGADRGPGLLGEPLGPRSQGGAPEAGLGQRRVDGPRYALALPVHRNRGKWVLSQPPPLPACARACARPRTSPQMGSLRGRETKWPSRGHRGPGFQAACHHLPARGLAFLLCAMGSELPSTSGVVVAAQGPGVAGQCLSHWAEQQGQRGHLCWGVGWGWGRTGEAWTKGRLPGRLPLALWAEA